MATEPGMKNKRTNVVCLTLCLALCLALASCGDSDQPTKAAAPEPLDLALFISPGAGPGQAVAVVRLYSQLARQQVLDNRLRPKEKRQEIKAYSMAGGAELWTKKLVFEVAPDGQGQAASLSPAQGNQCRAVGYPKAETLSPGKGITYQAVYRLEAPQALTPGSSIRAVLSLEGRKITSQARVMPQPPANTVQAALLRARNARWLGDIAGMLKAGQELSASDPASPAGPWYQGLAQERLGDKAAALASYKKAMSLWRQKAKDRKYAEPPMGLARRISRLQKPNN